MLELSARLLYANIILLGTVPGKVRYTFDEETAELVLGIRYGLGERLDVFAGLPVILQYGGFLDAPIKFFEDLFGAPYPGRAGRPNNLTVFQITGPTGETLERFTPGVGLGDLTLGLKGQLLLQHGPWPAVALRLAVKLPTGGPTYSSGEVDLGGSLLFGWTMGRVGLRFAFDVDVPTASTAIVALPTKVYGALQAGAAIELGAGVALQLQASAHRSPLLVPRLGEPSYYFLVGLTAALSRSLRLEVAGVENIFSPVTGSDITFLLGVRGEL